MSETFLGHLSTLLPSAILTIVLQGKLQGPGNTLRVLQGFGYYGYPITITHSIPILVHITMSYPRLVVKIIMPAELRTLDRPTYRHPCKNVSLRKSNTTTLFNVRPWLRGTFPAKHKRTEKKLNTLDVYTLPCNEGKGYSGNQMNGSILLSTNLQRVRQDVLDDNFGAIRHVQIPGIKHYAYSHFQLENMIRNAARSR